MKKEIVLVLLALALNGVASDAQPQFERPLARLTVRVVGEDAAPISGAAVRISFTDKVSNQPRLAEGQTDLAGFFSGEGFSDLRLNADARKDGYYISGSPWIVFTNKADGRYLPWNSTVEVMLRKIQAPVPVCAKWVWITVPEIDKSCGFDLLEGDWVAPWGKGKNSDFLFTLKREFTNRQQFVVTVNIAFSNLLDGIQETQLPKEFAQSQFIWPRQAPEGGYLSSLYSQLAAPGLKPRIQDVEKQKFFFRVRTVEKDGKIVSALYGKLSEGFQLSPSNSRTCMVRLCYYLNPTPLDRNMEFDLKRNLLKNVGQFEEPKRP